MDLVPSEFRRWGLCTACCEDMACWAPFGALVSAWLNLSRQYSSAHHQNRDTGGQLLKWWWDASLRQVLTVSGCRAAPMTPAQVEMQTEQVQFEEPALSAEQMSANQAGALYIVLLCCVRLPAPWCSWRAGALHLHAIVGVLQDLWAGLCWTMLLP